MGRLDVIAFDADDTLWHNESIYHGVQERFKVLLAGYASPETVDRHLFEKEMGNLALYGYGIKSFTLSMIETAVDLSEGKITGGEIKKIVDFAREMLANEIELIEGVPEVVRALSETHPLMLLTKGDLLDQEIKLARSGLGRYFRYFEVVSTKTRQTYQNLLEKYHLDSRRFLMIGNSLKSDVLPVVELGGYGVYIPYHITWAHEAVEGHAELGNSRLFELERVGQVPALLRELDAD